MEGGSGEICDGLRVSALLLAPHGGWRTQVRSPLPSQELMVHPEDLTFRSSFVEGGKQRLCAFSQG